MGRTVSLARTFSSEREEAGEMPAFVVSTQKSELGWVPQLQSVQVEQALEWGEPQVKIEFMRGRQRQGVAVQTIYSLHTEVDKASLTSIPKQPRST